MSRLKNPTILEINAWTWLHALSRKHGRAMTLETLPTEELDELKWFDAVWLMGVWERSPKGREVALHHPSLQNEYRRALPDFEPKDVVGSPYSIRRYRVADLLGGPGGLAAIRSRLAERGILLVLDFVPNHVAADHDWTTETPAVFVRGSHQDLLSRPETFFEEEGQVFAHGREVIIDYDTVEGRNRVLVICYRT